MAGDWIKMRIDLQTHPKVVRIVSALKADKLRVIGGLHAVWCLFDTHSEDGTLNGYTFEAIDDEIRWPGFSAAMESVDWISTDGESSALPGFDEHNGQSAKRRAQETKRKREDRKAADEAHEDGRNLSALKADKNQTREKKRREEKKEQNLTTTNVVVAASDAGVDLPGIAKPEKLDCPHQEIIALYHEVLPQCPRIRDWTTARATQLRARWNEDPTRQNLAYWRRLFVYVASCDFLVGKSQRKDRKPFVAGLEWIVKASNFTKIREEHYENN